MNVTPGTTVCWTNRGTASHTVTSNTGAFGSPLLAQNETFSFTFTQEGSFAYHCEPHQFMTGTVNVSTGPPPPPPPPPAPGVLLATVGTNDGTNISLTRNGQAVTQIPAGTYTIEVRDRSRVHNFHLTGRGVNESTTVAFVGTVTWTVTFTQGIYTFVCDPHASFMHGTFGVDRAPPGCKVPRVVGKKLPAARRLITRARCRVGRVRRARSARARGRVLSQSPRAGARRPRGTRVNLVVSRGRR